MTRQTLIARASAFAAILGIIVFVAVVLANALTGGA